MNEVSRSWSLWRADMERRRATAIHIGGAGYLGGLSELRPYKEKAGLRQSSRPVR